MNRKTLLCIGLGTYLLCWLSLLVFPCFNCTPSLSNFISFQVLFITLAIFVPIVCDLLHSFLRRFRIFRPKLGEVLVRYGHISREQLNEALEIQQLKIGEILLYGGYVSEPQIQEALKVQKRQKGKKLGEILKDLGYISSDQIKWATVRVHRKLGQILLEGDLITRTELRGMLGRIRSGKFGGFEGAPVDRLW
jgi:hypothetical protein